MTIITSLISSHLSLYREGRWFHNHFSPFFLLLHHPLGLGELLACPFPDVVFLPLPLSALSSSPLSLCLARWFWPNLINGRHIHTTAVCVFLRWSQVFVWSDCLLDLGTDFLVGNMVREMRSIFGSTSFPWLVFFFGARL